MLTRQQLRRQGRRYLDFCLKETDYSLSRSERRKIARERQKLEWAKRDKVLIEKLKHD